jgi:hypothetical protein
MGIEFAKVEKHTPVANQRNIFCSCSLLIIFCLSLWVSFIYLSAVCNADTYGWTDKEGNLHISDLPPEDKTLENSLKVDETEPEPLVEGKRVNRVVYQDDVFRIVLVDEKYESLTFELSYINIKSAYPDIFKMEPHVYVCAGHNNESGDTYLFYDQPGMEKNKNNNTITLTNKMSNQSPSDLKTTYLRLGLYQLYNDTNFKQQIRYLFNKKIPFEKKWAKF